MAHPSIVPLLRFISNFATGHIRQTVAGSRLILDFNTDAEAQTEMRIELLAHGPLTATDLML